MFIQSLLKGSACFSNVNTLTISRFHHTSHSDEPLSYHVYRSPDDASEMKKETCTSEGGVELDEMNEEHELKQVYLCNSVCCYIVLSISSCS